jgi:hypothetical protein
VLAEGTIAPVEGFSDKPAEALKVPPELPVRVTACAVVTDAQKGEPA